MAREECEKCKASGGDIEVLNRFPDDDPSFIHCLKCGHDTRYFRVTDRGREVLEKLLGKPSKEEPQNESV